MLLDTQCPRCGGPITILENEFFDWNCPACQLAVKIEDTGRVSASMPMRNGKGWYDEPWSMPWLESFQPKK